eukprot:CAMPEP_0119365468 /NCGR_PEP_ID=MMETSP1334-20130426/12415_1 /TAXON_ID=127549 /ORGANISM="Calcidiscus leptoporus, Strain RCC1130" /LENGTH=325 /DNA_ID=CAMNT_0007381463 /DNA_START=27 /DNA_END=1004 /DNA_ORIENTATION=-
MGERISVLFWKQPQPEGKAKQSAPADIFLLTARFILFALACMFFASAISKQVKAGNDNAIKTTTQTGMRMLPIPKAELIHTELVETDFAPLYSASSPPPPPPPSLPPPLHMPAWVEESLKPARPLDPNRSRAALNSAHPWAYLVRDARPGTVLVGGKPLAGELSYLNGAVILLLHVCGCQPSIYGVILNAPTNSTMGTAFCANAAARYPAFVNSTIRDGGPFERHWTVLSRMASDGAREVEPGLYAGGSLAELQQRVWQGKETLDAVAFYRGYVAWHLDDLREQIGHGHWQVVKASPKLLFQPPQAQPSQAGREAFHQSLLAALT